MSESTQGCLGRLVEQPDLLDPVHPEVPDGAGQVAVRLQVGVPVGDQQPQRVDRPLGHGVPGRRVVADPDPPGLVQRLPDQARARAPDRPAPPGPRRSRRRRAGRRRAPAWPAPSAPPPRRPGRAVSASARSATVSANASSEVSRTGRSMPASKAIDDRAAVLVQHHVDQVVRVVAGQPADHQQVQVGADLLGADAELGGQLADRDARPAGDVRHQRQHPGQPVGRGLAHASPLAHAGPRRQLVSRARPAGLPGPAPERRSPPSPSGCRSATGPSRRPGRPAPRPRRPGPCPAIRRAVSHRCPSGSVTRSQSGVRRADCLRRSTAPCRRRPGRPARPDPHGRDSDRPGRSTLAATSASRSTPAGGRTAPARPTVFTGPVIRDSRNVRRSPRFSSCPMTYQRPRKETSPQGCSCRGSAGAVGSLR